MAISSKFKKSAIIAIIFLLTGFVLSINRYQAWKYVEERTNLRLGKLIVSLPNGPPEVAALVKQDSGSRRLASYTYGFRYPSMHLYRKEDFREWAMIGDGSDWVRVEASTAPKPSCDVHVFSSWINPEFSLIRLFLAHSSGRPERYRYAVMAPADAEFGLKHLRLPADPFLWDSNQYFGSSDVYSSGPPQCAEIACDLRQDLKNKTPNCKHTVTDTSTHITYSLNYSGSLLRNWSDIQAKAIALVTAMQRDSENGSLNKDN